MKRENAISLIALIITIIVIIILAAIVITMSLSTPQTANYAKFTNDISSIQEVVTMKYAEKYSEKVITGIAPSNAEIYSELIKENGEVMANGAVEIDKTKLGADLPSYKTANGTEQKWYLDINSGNVYIDPPYEYEGKVYEEAKDISSKEELVKVIDETPGTLAQDEEGTYLIESIEDLVAFGVAVNGGNKYTEQKIKLKESLNFKKGISYVNPATEVFGDINENGIIESLQLELTTGKGFKPIGTESETIYFAGEFDGNGKEIKEIYINRIDEESVGLFGVNRGTIKNLGIKSGEIKSTTQNIATRPCVGSIAGQCYSGGIINNCYNGANIYLNSQTIDSWADIGGISGNVMGSNATIKNTYNYGKVEATGQRTIIGGICGVLNGGIIQNVYNAGNVNAKLAGGTRYWLYEAGGVAYTANNVTNAYNIGGITNTNTGATWKRVGGISANAPNTVTNCKYWNQTAEYGVYGIADNVSTAIGVELSEMPSILSIINSENAFKEDTEKVNNGYPVFN